MRVLVVAGSKHGATLEIAGAVAGELRARGHDVTTVAPESARDVSGYDAFVIGSAIYVGHWTKETRHFVDAHRADLAGRPVWLFSSGPLGGTPQLEDADEVEELAASLGARGHELFAGALSKESLSFVERAAVKAVHAPYGDYRDWDAVRRWAGEIADRLSTPR